MFYASGPGDSIATYRHWKQGCDDPSEPVVAYSGQFFDLCRELKAEAFVLSTCPRRDQLRDGQFRIEHRPHPAHESSGIRFHLGQLSYGLRMIFTALRFQPDLTIVNEGAHWFTLALLTVARIPVVPSLHVRLSQPVSRKAVLRRTVSALNRLFFRHCCSALLVASPEIQSDLQLGPRPRAKAFCFLPLYRRATFDNIAQPQHGQRPFNVMYIGRVEANKGALDLVRIARLVCRERKDVLFHVCGTGSASEELQKRMSRAGLESRFRLHGYCNRARLAQMYGRAHVVIVPTRSEIGEGFNQVTAEAVLAGRPVIASSLCPAVNYVREAVVEVRPDDLGGYARAILMLASDEAAYRSRQEASAKVQAPFYDSNHSWGAGLKQIVLSLCRPPAEDKKEPCGTEVRRVREEIKDSNAVCHRS